MVGENSEEKDQRETDEDPGQYDAGQLERKRTELERVGKAGEGQEDMDKSGTWDSFA